MTTRKNKIVLQLAFASLLLLATTSSAWAVAAPEMGGGGGHWVTIPAHYECRSPCPDGYVRNSSGQCVVYTPPPDTGGCTGGTGKPMLEQSSTQPCDAQM